MNRFKAIFVKTDRSRPYNFHSHTQFCDGRALMADFAAVALRRGFSAYGFSPHSPVKGLESPCNMKADDVPAYLDEFSRLKDEYAGRLDLYCSMEIDYLDEQHGPSADFYQRLPLDYRIGSVHFIPSPRDGMIDIDGRFASFRRKMVDNFDNDIRGVCERFFEQTASMIERGGFDIVGHIDKIGHNASLWQPGIADEPWFDHSVRELIRMAADRGLAIEVNTKALKTAGRLFPDLRYFTLLRQTGAMLPVNSDAHYPDLIEAGRPEALDLLQ